MLDPGLRPSCGLFPVEFPNVSTPARDVAQVALDASKPRSTRPPSKEPRLERQLIQRYITQATGLVERLLS